MITNIHTVHTAAMQKQAEYATPPKYIPGNKPFTSAPPTGNWFQRFMSNLGTGIKNFLGNDAPFIGRRLGIYDQPRVKWSPDSPQAVDAKRNPKAWEQVKRTDDPNMLLSMGDWGERNFARLRNIAKNDPAYELARMTGVREEDIINHHLRKYEMPRYRAVTGNKNMHANKPYSPEEQQKAYDMDVNYKLKSAPVPLGESNRAKAAQYLKDYRLAQEELSANQDYTTIPNIPVPFKRETSPELYDWLVASARR